MRPQPTRHSTKNVNAATCSLSSDGSRGAEGAHVMPWTHQTSDASSSASASVAVENSLVFGGVDVSGAYGVGGTHLRTSHLPTKHDLGQLQSVVASPNCYRALTVQRCCMRMHATGGGCGVNNRLQQRTGLLRDRPLHCLCTDWQCDGSLYSFFLSWLSCRAGQPRLGACPC